MRSPLWTAFPAGPPMVGTFGGDILYDTLSLGAAAISIHDTNRYIPIVQGNYTVLLQGSFPGGAVVPAIGQVGTVPADARSVRYYGQGPYTVTFGGQAVPVT